MLALGGDPANLRPRGVYCEGEGDARRIVTWEASHDNPLEAVETRWRLLTFEGEGRWKARDPRASPVSEGQ
jgi:hypothetical protein